MLGSCNLYAKRMWSAFCGFPAFAGWRLREGASNVSFGYVEHVLPEKYTTMSLEIGHHDMALERDSDKDVYTSPVNSVAF
jgi:hypothetical protein